LKECLEKARGYGLEAESALRQGDPPSELLKFLAESRSYQTVVWGGNEVFLRGGRVPVRGHWLARIREELNGALVVPSLKRKQA